MLVKKVPLEAVQKNYNHYAKSYEQHWQHFLSPTRQWVLNHFPDGQGNLLNLGCGTGRFLSDIKMRYPDLNITGIDGSEDMLAIARDNVPDGQFNQGDLEELSLEGQKFDVILCLNVLHHLKDQKVLLRKIRHALKPNGVAFIGDYAIETPMLKLAEIYWRLFHRAHHKALSIKEFKALLEGFKIEEEAYLKADWFWRLQVYKVTAP